MLVPNRQGQGAASVCLRSPPLLGLAGGDTGLRCRLQVWETRALGGLEQVGEVALLNCCQVPFMEATFLSAGGNRFWESHSRSVTLGLSWICLGQVGICWYPTDKSRMPPQFA